MVVFRCAVRKDLFFGLVHGSDWFWRAGGGSIALRISGCSMDGAS
jgi:hypothetical protein